MDKDNKNGSSIKVDSDAEMTHSQHLGDSDVITYMYIYIYIYIGRR